MNRRIFLKHSTLASFCFSLSPSLLEFESLAQKVTVGIISDLHQDIMHDGYARMESFINAVKKQKPDAIVQMGDFAVPKPENSSVIDLFNQAHEKSFHVIGNHDTDSGYTKEQCLNTWGMPATYYSAEIKGVKLIVLDGNEKGSPTHKGGYVSYIGPDQMEWLKTELETSEMPVMVISHQPLAGMFALDNATEIQSLLSQYAEKILLCLNGHSHIDQHLLISNVNYLHINSASYYWVGENYKHDSFSEDILKDHPTIAMTCPYEESLFAFLTIDPVAKKISIKGKKSKWVGPSPEKLGYQTEDEKNLYNWVTPEIKHLKISSH